MKNYVLIFTLLFNISIGHAAGMSDLFKLPDNLQNDTSTVGRSGGMMAKLAKGCKKMKNSLMKYASIFQLTTMYDFHFPLLSQDIARAAGGGPILWAPWFDLAVPGVSGTHEDPLIMKICDIVIQFDRQGVASGALAASHFANDLTGGGHNAKLMAADKLFNAANTLVDLQTGNVRKGALTSAYTHKQLIDAANAMKKAYSEDGEGFETEAVRKQKLDKLAKLSYQRTILEETTRCSKPTGNTNFLKKYNNYVPEREIKVKNAELDIDYYYRTLLDLGSSFIVDVDELKKYTHDINHLRINSYNYKPSKYKYVEKDNVLTNTLDKNGKPKRRDKKVTRIVYTYKGSFDSAGYSEISDRWVKKWEKWVTGQLLVSGTFGLFDGKKGRIEEKFRSFSYECSDRKLEKIVTPRDRKNPLFYTNLRKERENCRKNLKIRENDTKNLMDSYLTKLTNAIKIKNKNMIEIWNFEAKELGRLRIISDVPGQNQNLKDFQTKEVSCSSEASIATLNIMKQKAKNVNLALKNEWMLSTVKAEMKQDAKDNGDRLQLEEQKRKENHNKEIRNNLMSPSPSAAPSLKTIKGI